MPELVKVLVLGATSYQGSMLVRPLLAHKNRFTVTAIEKAGDSAKKLKEDGCAIVEGDPESSAVLQKAAKDADVVFSLSFADKLEPVKALVGAIKAKGKKGILIHVSGCTVLADNSKSEKKSETVYSDKQPESLSKLPDTQKHRKVDKWLQENSKEITCAIVCPPLVYGAGSDKHLVSVEIPLIFHAMVNTKKAAMVGPGNGVWNCVHLLDLVHFYVALMNEMLERGPDKRQDLEGLYFCESGEFAWKDLFKAVADAMVAMKALEPYKEMGTFTADEMKKYMMGDETWSMLGSNARCKAERAGTLGWKPTQKGLLETVADDVARAYHAHDTVR